MSEANMSEKTLDSVLQIKRPKKVKLKTGQVWLTRSCELATVIATGTDTIYEEPNVVVVTGDDGKRQSRFYRDNGSFYRDEISPLDLISLILPVAPND